MTCFEALNLTIEACTFTNAHGDEFENESNIRLELPLRSFYEQLTLWVFAHYSDLIWMSQW